MEEIILDLERTPLDLFFGVNQKNIQLLKSTFPNLIIIARSNILKIQGTPKDLDTIQDTIIKIKEYINNNTSVKQKTIKQIILFPEQEITKELTILHAHNGKTIKAITPAQIKMTESIKKNDLVFAVGNAGSGKTYTAVALAVKHLKNKNAKRIILTRPAVESGESLGFLPGDLKDKLDPYLQPLYDALRDMIPSDKLKEYFEEEVIQIVPLAFMRGRTLKKAFVILDEAQNATHNQMKMFLTRMGKNAKFIVTGDVSQIDLQKKEFSGLEQSIQLLNSLNGVAVISFHSIDNRRHPLVNDIITRYNPS